mmetsp:Transcript_19973/g.53159  ORF Transcript_19973/g.53159 Transcript_19973/m.53159 type:complete len:220 (-) Transcript_19973:311-970(-)
MTSPYFPSASISLSLEATGNVPIFQLSSGSDPKLKSSVPFSSLTISNPASLKGIRRASSAAKDSGLMGGGGRECPNTFVITLPSMGIMGISSHTDAVMTPPGTRTRWISLRAAARLGANISPNETVTTSIEASEMPDMDCMSRTWHVTRPEIPNALTRASAWETMSGARSVQRTFASGNVSASRHPGCPGPEAMSRMFSGLVTPWALRAATWCFQEGMI